jgi:hypothetical protein
LDARAGVEQTNGERKKQYRGGGSRVHNNDGGSFAGWRHDNNDGSRPLINAFRLLKKSRRRRGKKTGLGITMRKATNGRIHSRTNPSTPRQRMAFVEAQGAPTRQTYGRPRITGALGCCLPPKEISLMV